MKYIKKYMLLCIIAALLGLCGCQKSSQQPQAVKAEEDTIEIGLSVDSFIIERWIRDRDVFVATAKELGAEVNVQDAGGDLNEQISQLEYLIEKKMDVIVVIARDCSALSEVLAKAKSKGIGVISYDRLVYNTDSDLYISFNNRQVGVLMAQNLIEAIPQGGKVFMIQGSKDDDNVSQVKSGFEDTIKDSDLEVFYTANCAGWNAEEAVRYVEEGIQKCPEVKGIMCGNDDIAAQVIQVLAEYKMAGKVIVVGQDGDVAACQRIVEGTQYMTAFKDIDDEAREAAKYAVLLAKGEELKDVSDTVDDGSFQVPSVILDPVAVTRENMDEIIVEGGFHRKEDVYLNVNTP